MNRISNLPLVATLVLGAIPASAFGNDKPQFHPIWIPKGKTLQDVKPRVEARADEPVVLELRAHRHADGSFHLVCDHDHETASTVPAAQFAERQP